MGLSRISLILWLVMGFCGSAWISGCAEKLVSYGASFTPEDIAALQVGRTTDSEVRELLGAPSTLVDETGRDWLYIRIQKAEPVLQRSRIVKRDLLWLEFNDSGLLLARDLFTATEEEIITPDPDITPSVGRKLTFIEDLFGLNRAKD